MGVFRDTFAGVELESDGSRPSILENLCGGASVSSSTVAISAMFGGSCETIRRYRVSVRPNLFGRRILETRPYFSALLYSSVGGDVSTGDPAVSVANAVKRMPRIE